MSAILNLSEKGWKDDLQSYDLPERTQEILSKAIRAVTANHHPFPRVSADEFYGIIDNQVLFIRLGSKGFILDKKGKKNKM